MKAIILSAGRGSRMGALTGNRPKALVEIGGRTLLDRQLHALRTAGATTIGVVAGWHAEAFDDTGEDLTVFTNPHWESTTMVHSLAAAEPWLSRETVLAAYGDIVYTPQTVRRLAAATAPLAIAYDPHWHTQWSRRFTDPLTDAETFTRDRRGMLTGIGGRPRHLAEVQGQYMGLLRITPPAWALIRRTLHTHDRHPTPGPLDMTAVLARLVREQLTTIATVPVSGPWWEFDHPSDITGGGLEVLAALDAAENADPDSGAAA